MESRLDDLNAFFPGVSQSSPAHLQGWGSTAAQLLENGGGSTSRQPQRLSPMALLGASGQLISCSWWNRGPNKHWEGTELLLLLLHNYEVIYL